MHVHVHVMRIIYKNFMFPCAVQLTAEGVGCRFWHTTVMSHSSSRMRQLLTFGGCPGAPESHTTGSWPKMADTFLMEIGTMECAVYMYVVHVSMHTCLLLPSNHSLYRLIAGYRMGWANWETT